MYLLLASGYLAVVSEDGAPKVVDSSKIIMVQLLLGWIAGFRQQSIADLVQGIIQSIVSLLKLVGRLINPFILFNTAKREALLEEIGKRTEIFQAVDWDESTSENRKWWQFD